MTNLKTVNIGMNKYCGPAVLSILTGKSTDECAKVISKINGKYNVTGVLIDDLISAAIRLGFNSHQVPAVGSLYRTLTTLIGNDGMYIVTIANHFICIEIKDKKIYFCDNHTKEPIPAASSARLGQTVLDVHKVWKNPDYVEETPKPPVHQISQEYVELVNLIAAAKHHKKYCMEPDCNVSLTVLKTTAVRLLSHLLYENEYSECEKLISETEWF